MKVIIALPDNTDCIQLKIYLEDGSIKFRTIPSVEMNDGLIACESCGYTINVKAGEEIKLILPEDIINDR